MRRVYIGVRKSVKQILSLTPPAAPFIMPLRPMKISLIPRVVASRSIRTQTGMLFFAGLFLLVATTFGVSLLISRGIQQDTVALAELQDARVRAEGSTAISLDTSIAVVRERLHGNTGMVRGLYAALFLASLVFLFVGLWFIQQIIVAPLESIHLASRRIAEGDLDTPTKIGGAMEFQDLADSFEAMRVELRESRTEQTRWTADLETRVSQRTQQLAALQERERIGIELHDGLLQTLGYLYIKTDQMEDLALEKGLDSLARLLAAQRDVIEQTSQDVRRFISNLHESPPPPAHLQSALLTMIGDFHATAPGDTSMRANLVAGDQAMLLPADVVVHLVAIAREALTNAALHGRASSAAISYRGESNQGWLIVDDDGRGFDPGIAPVDGRPHFGLSVMHARAARIGGSLEIESAREKGTHVRVCWPLRSGGADG